MARLALVLLACASATLTGCSHGSSALLPRVPSSTQGAQSTRHALSVSGSDVVAINVSGPAVGAFVADVDGTGGTTSTSGDTIDVSSANAAPASVYQTQRYGPMTYSIPGLSAGMAYDVRLHFAELYFGLGGRQGAGARQFNVALNGANVLSNFDIYATAGSADKAVVRDFVVAANANGQIVIALTNGNANLAALNGIEILATPTNVPNGEAAIKVGGPAIGPFVADTDGSGGTVSTTSDTIDVSASNAASVGVYLSQRWGPMTYTVPGFSPGAAYTVRLHFAEMYWGADGRPGGIGSRKFNVAINGVNAISNLDVYARAGGANKALAIDTSSVADPSGRFAIALTNGAADNAMLNAIEIIPLPTIDVQALNVAGGAAGVFAPDTMPNGGNNGWISWTGDTINASAQNAAPAFVYQSQRFGSMQRAFNNLMAGASYTVRLHFAELYFGLAGRPGNGQRQFNIALNGTTVATNFDVFAAAGAAETAVVRDFSTNADGNGIITLTLTNGAHDNAMLSGVEILGNGPPAPIVVGSEPARSSDAFVDSIGVNTHLSNFATLYGSNFPLIRSLLAGSGIRHLRDGTPAGNAQLCTQEGTFAAVGIHMMVISDGSSYDITRALPCLGSTTESLEGDNEADLAGDPNWVSFLIADTQAIASQNQQYALTAPSVTSVGAEQQIASLGSVVQFGNAHAYFAGRNPGTGGWGGTDQFGTYGSLAYNLNVATVVSGTKPIVITETGYSDNPADSYALPATTKARYTLRTFLETWNAGVPRTYLYEFLDEGTVPFSHYGLVDASGNPKLAYTAIASFTGRLSDAGGSFQSTPLKYSFATTSGSVHHTLLQKRNGTYELVIWNESPEWDPNANATIATTAQMVGLTFATPPSALSQSTFNDAGSLTTSALSPAAFVPVNAGAWPTIIEITP